MGQYLSDTISPGAATARRTIPNTPGRLWIWEQAGTAGAVTARTRDGSITVQIPANGFRTVDFDMDVTSLEFTGNGAQFSVDFGSGYRISEPWTFETTGALLTQA